MSLFKIKICGITRPNDAVLAAVFGADAIGLNFYGPSVRSVSVVQASEIARHLRAKLPPTKPRPQLVGVFVNHTVDEIAAAVMAVGLDMIQLHGDERPDFVVALRAAGVALKAKPIVRAVRVSRDLAVANSAALVEEIEQWAAVGVQMVLLDAAVPGAFGGTGHQLDWQAVADANLALPVVLAGGLTDQNVSQAIQIARPAAVDVASGVESADGEKSESLMRRFVSNARLGFGENG